MKKTVKHLQDNPKMTIFATGKLKILHQYYNQHSRLKKSFFVMNWRKSDLFLLFPHNILAILTGANVHRFEKNAK